MMRSSARVMNCSLRFSCPVEVCKMVHDIRYRGACLSGNWQGMNSRIEAVSIVLFLLPREASEAREAKGLAFSTAGLT